MMASPPGPSPGGCIKDYRAGRLPARRNRRAPMRRATRNTTMPMISKYSRPLTTTPTMPSAIATITRNRKKAIIRSSAQLLRLAAAQPPLAGGARLVGQAVVREDGLFPGGGQLAVGVDRGGVLHLLLVVGDLEVPGAHGRAVERHEYEPVPGPYADLDGTERRQVGAGVDIDRLQLPDLVVVGVNHVVATPFPDVGRLEHAAFFPRAVFAYSSTLGHESQTRFELAAC